ncbi:hypothetical protein DN068_18715 [Taibaiella soli]|uniref:Uncharacterized protein n=2 Tax=Taibaiella soli TaxID=1649169 RepID=A0A2W2B528_9BACT|nr:hypothetical protein DN068_18715 [Taibaiella soli]
MLFNYQGVARNTNGQAMANQSVSLRLSIIDGSTSGTAQYVETQATTTNQFGLFNVQIGGGTAVTGTMGAVTWGSGNKYIKVEMDPGGGTTYTDMGTAQLLSVPYALQAGNASGLAGVQDKVLKRSIYIPAGAFGRINGSGNIYPNAWGLNWKNSTEKAGFVIPRPRDWDSTTAFTITIYFAIPSATSGAAVNWRLNAGGNITNTNSNNAATGWDSYDYWATEDAGVTTYPAAGSYTTLGKSQTWTSHYSTTYNEWYFGSGVTTADAFKSNPVWHFTFTRGSSVSNGETYTGDMTVSGVEIQYTAVH